MDHSSWREDPQRVNYSLGINAKQLCSGVFVVGRGPDDLIANDLSSDQFPELFAWDEITIDIDRTGGRVTLTAPDGQSRTAVHNPGQGCSLLPVGADDVFFSPTPVVPDLPDAASTPWPMGDLIPDEQLLPEVDLAVVEAAIDAAFDDSRWETEQRTRGVVVVYKGRLIAERYASGFDKDTRQVCWSTGKSIIAALVGILVKDGAFGIDDYAPIDEWHALDDPRRMIRIRHLLNMSSGLLFRSAWGGDPPEISLTSLDDHSHVYVGAIDVLAHSIGRPLEFTPGTFWRYRNCDPLTLGGIVRRTNEARGENHLTFPQRRLFDRIGIRNLVLETDAWGNFVATGFEWGTPRDWARFGLLHLWDGVWQPTGERVLPEGWVRFVRSPAPADPSLNYGGQFWLNRAGRLPNVPRDAYWPLGGMGQIPVIVPSRDLVVVRMGASQGDHMPMMDHLVSGVLAAIGGE